MARGLCSLDRVDVPAPFRLVPDEPVRPPLEEVLGAWASARSVVDDPEVYKWIEGRGLDPRVVAALDLARALPVDTTMPPWMTYLGRPWAATSHRMLIEMVDVSGVAKSLHARALASSDPKGRDKAAHPKGAEVSGLIMANAEARAMLRTRRARDVVISEGVPDFLSRATRWSVPECPAVIGVVSGSWSPELAARVPDGARVVVRTHQDAAGEKYAEQIVRSLGRRCEVLRPRRSP